MNLTDTAARLRREAAAIAAENARVWRSIAAIQAAIDRIKGQDQ